MQRQDTLVMHSNGLNTVEKKPERCMSTSERPFEALHRIVAPVRRGRAQTQLLNTAGNPTLP